MSEPRPIYPKHFLREPVPRANTGFILMPFADEFEPVHEAIRAAIESARLKPLRADDIFSTRAGMEKILRGIAEAEVVVADMSGQNANVFYEVGIAHTHRENVILLMREDDDFPFDLQHIDHVTYTTTEDGLVALTKKLASVIKDLTKEPPFEVPRVQPMAPDQITPAELRRVLRQQLQACERQWVEEIVPAQSRLFQDQFGELLKTSRPKSEWEKITEKVISTLQPAFLSPWESIEDIGFKVIEEEERLWSAMPELTRALEHAYSLGDRLQKREHPTVVGQGQLLALRTWTLWGAYALDCGNWKAVGNLLHGPVKFDRERQSFAQHRGIHYPDGAGLGPGDGNADLAARSVYDHGEKAQLFGDLEVMKGLVGLWQFAVNLAYALENDSYFSLFPSWRLSPYETFSSLVGQLETDPKYARNFVTAVANLEPRALNETWVNGLRGQLQGYGRESFSWPGLHELPKRFAEPERRAINWSRPS